MNQPTRATNDDELDRAFAAYFKSHAPAQWPTVRTDPLVTASARSITPTPSNSASNQLRSQLTLAASVAALLGLGLYISSGTRTAQPSGSASSTEPALMKNAEASGNKLIQKLPPSPAK